MAQSLNVSVVVETKGHLTRSGPMPAAGVGGDYSADLITKACLNLIAKLNEASVEDEVSWIPRLGNITVAATKFEDCSRMPQTASVANFFGKRKAVINSEQAQTVSVTSEQKDQVVNDDVKEQNCEITSEELSDIELVKCERCSEMVSPFELPEHLDYHVAQDVSAQMRREVVQEQRNLQASKMAPSSGKRKKNTHTVEPDPKKQRNISAFFTKK